jgi:hypothetical protein
MLHRRHLRLEWICSPMPMNKLVYAFLPAPLQCCLTPQTIPEHHYTFVPFCISNYSHCGVFELHCLWSGVAVGGYIRSIEPLPSKVMNGSSVSCWGWGWYGTRIHYRYIHQIIIIIIRVWWCRLGCSIIINLTVSGGAVHYCRRLRFN